MIRGRARVPFLVALAVVSGLLAVAVTPQFGFVTIAAVVVLGQLYFSESTRHPDRARPDRAPVTDWLRSRHARRRDRS